MAVELIYGTSTALAITLASIADGAGRISDRVDNSTNASGSDRAQAIQVWATITSGGVVPTDDALYKFFVIGHDTGTGTPNISDGGFGGVIKPKVKSLLSESFAVTVYENRSPSFLVVSGSDVIMGDWLFIASPVSTISCVVMFFPSVVTTTVSVNKISAEGKKEI